MSQRDQLSIREQRIYVLLTVVLSLGALAALMASITWFTGALQVLGFLSAIALGVAAKVFSLGSVHGIRVLWSSWWRSK